MFIVNRLEIDRLSLSDSRPSLRAGGIVEGGGLLRDPVWGIPATVYKSRPSLRAGGLLN